MSSTAADGAASRALPPIRRLLALVMALAAVGWALAADILRPGRPDHGEAVSGARGIAGARTSFGSFTVKALERRAAPERSHRGPHVVPTDAVRMSVTVKNSLSRRVLYSPGQFLLRAGRGLMISAVNPNPPPGSIGARSRIRQRLVFLVPAPLSRLALEFDDLEASQPVAVDLGRTPAEASASFAPHIDHNP